MKKLFIILALFMFSMNSMGQGVVTRQKSKPKSEVSTENRQKSKAKSEVSTQNKKKTKNKQKESSVSQPTIHAIERYEYVDLGLPSGILWATCNVGASKPEEYGDYFAWGEITGYNSGKSDFTFKTYKYCRGTEVSLTKYCTDSKHGIVDNKISLESSDDAATANWGSNWRMPTKKEFEELINSSFTTSEWTNQGGINGYLITSKKNGNSIFLPAAGLCKNKGTGSFGFYSSSSIVMGYSEFIWCLNFASPYISVDNTYFRSVGYSVRPVCTKISF